MPLSEYNSQEHNKSRWRPPPPIMIRPTFGARAGRLLGDNHGEATRMWAHYARKSVQHDYAGKESLYPIRMSPFWSDPRNLLISNLLRAMNNVQVNVNDIYVNIAFTAIMGYVAYITEKFPWFVALQSFLSLADFTSCRLWGSDSNPFIGDNLRTPMTESSNSYN